MNQKSFCHASNIPGLTQIEPLSAVRGSNERVCYFTPNRTYALFYLRDMDVNHVTCGVSDDGIVVYHEQFPNQLEMLYKGRNGAIYHCESDEISQGHTSDVWIAVTPVKVTGEEFVADVYSEILKAEQSGTARIIRYETLSNEKKAEIIEMMRDYITENQLLGSQSPKARFMRTYFPASWESATNTTEK
ncbi:MAG: hypothetical protein LBN00_06000 [Oscillospiraceae bacterium]|jgi:ribosome-binding factor A|nr:hypothetical protein [Oscillospiraceae bacterium]